MNNHVIKIVSFAIGMCGSAKPEKQAEAAIEAILKEYDIVPKKNNGQGDGA